MSTSTKTKTLLEVKNLKVYFNLEHDIGKAVDGVSLSLKKRDTLAIVGESGCGKTMTGLSILRLIPDPGEIQKESEIMFNGKDILEMSTKDLIKMRGNEISMIFQEPMTSLNPVYTIGNQMSEVFRFHQGMDKKQAREASIEMLKTVSIPSPEKRIDNYPHELSGGMRQRVMIAMALSCNPKLVIADEPTTALDVTIQAQILKLLKKLKDETHTSVILITHDLGIVAEISDYVAVMYAGRIVEYADVKTIYKKPLHPYTKALLASIPKMGEENQELSEIKGMVPKFTDLPVGCKFKTRCKYRIPQCDVEPGLTSRDDNGHLVRCCVF
jgi:peptide/nickel transport system ATP-binding protein/oligopeptide transport system ATP-binding protein